MSLQNRQHSNEKKKQTKKTLNTILSWFHYLSSLGREVIHFSRGIKKAAVFPDPVSATPMMSLFCRPMGIACLWIGVGSCKRMALIQTQDFFLFSNAECICKVRGWLYSNITCADFLEFYVILWSLNKYTGLSENEIYCTYLLYYMWQGSFFLP